MFAFRPCCMAHSWVMGRVHQSMRRRGSLWRPRSAGYVHTGGITTSGKPLAMYGADDPPYGKKQGKLSTDELYNSAPKKTLQIQRLPFSNWRRKPTIRPFLNPRIAYHQDFANTGHRAAWTICGPQTSASACG